MQTFLPFDNVTRSLMVLDYKRLGKQRVEAWQIARALTDPSYGWQHHPAVKMWRGHEGALIQYGIASCRAWLMCGYNDNMLPRFNAIAPLYPNIDMPSWFGKEDFHISHQSNLLRKAHTMTDAQMKLAGIPRTYYDQFFPGVPDDLDYYWPV